MLVNTTYDKVKDKDGKENVVNKSREADKCCYNSISFRFSLPDYWS